MLEELLLVLCGYSDHFLDNKNDADDEKSKSILGHQFSSLHPGEFELLNRLLSLGRYCRSFQSFIDRFNLLSHVKRTLLGVKNESFETENTEKMQNCHKFVGLSSISTYGFYYAAFAEGLRSVLDGYRQHLCSLEGQFLADSSHLNLFYINSELQSYFLVFSTIQSSIDRFSAENLRGCQLLSTINDTLQSGVPAVDAELGKIRQSCGSIFASQLTEFLTSGSINDKYNEFFLGRNLNIDSRDHENHDQPLIIVRNEFKPSFIANFLLEKICFIGEKIVLLKDELGNLIDDEEMSKIFDESCSEIRAVFRDTNFDPPKLNEPIETIRRALSKKLWQSIVDESGQSQSSAIQKQRNNLYYCLDQIKSYYFLGRGELFLALIDEIDAYSVKNCSSDLKNLKNDDLNKLLQRSFTKLQGENFDLSDLLTRDDIIRLEFRKNQPHDEIWQSLEPFLNVGNRLKPIFNQDLLQNCQKIFKFLFKIRYVQTNLHRCWLKQLKSRKTSPKFQLSTPSSAVLEAKIWRVNNLMLFFVNNLQFYLHVDVLDSSYRNLLDNFSLKNFNEYQRAVNLINEFVKNIVYQLVVLWKAGKYRKSSTAFWKIAKNSPRPFFRPKNRRL